MFWNKLTVLKRWFWCRSYLYLVCLCGLFYYEAFHIPCSHVFSPLFSNVVTSPGDERAGLCVSRPFVCLFFTRYFLFSFSLHVMVWLQLFIVTLHFTFRNLSLSSWIIKVILPRQMVAPDCPLLIVIFLPIVMKPFLLRNAWMQNNVILWVWNSIEKLLILWATDQLLWHAFIAFYNNA